MSARLLGRRVATTASSSLATRALRRGAHTRVAVVSPLDNPALRDLPSDVDAEFILLPDEVPTDGSLHDVEALLWIPPGKPTVLSELVRGGHMPNLKWAHGFYAGVDAIAEFATKDLAPANVPLSNGRGAFSSSLAEYALSCTLHFVKQVPRCIDNRRAKKWDKFVMGELRGMTMGLLGAGSIATATAQLAKAFGMKTVALRRNASKPDDTGAFDLVVGPYDGPILPAHKQALFEQCDVVVCTLPGTPATHHFVSAPELAAMRPGAIFISLGRGVAVDEAALDAALRQGKLGGVALDVYEVEPLPADSPLCVARTARRRYRSEPAPRDLEAP